MSLLQLSQCSNFTNKSKPKQESLFRRFIEILNEMGNRIQLAMKYFNDPEYHLINIDASHLHFIKSNKKELCSTSFLDHRFATSNRVFIKIPIEQYLEWNQSNHHSIQHINYIFHTSFCCSTLLSRCLSINGQGLALKEPHALMTLANFKRQASNQHRVKSLLSISLQLLGRRFDNEESILIKPTNTANNLIGDILTQENTGSIIFLFSDLKSFLISIIKKGEECRSFVRRVFNIITMDSILLNTLEPRQLMELSDLQIASIVWRLQIHEFLKYKETQHKKSILLVNCDYLLMQPQLALAETAKHFSYNLNLIKINDLIESPTFLRNSKYSDRSYDSQIRSKENENIYLAHTKSIEYAMQWSLKLDNMIPFSETLPSQTSIINPTDNHDRYSQPT